MVGSASVSVPSLDFNMFHIFAFIYYILLRCVTREYSMTSVTTKNYSIYVTRKYTTTNDEKYSIYATREYTTIFDLHDAYYSLLEWYMKHVFVAGLVTGVFFSYLVESKLGRGMSLRLSVHDSTFMQFRLGKTLPPLDFQLKWTVRCTQVDLYAIWIWSDFGITEIESCDSNSVQHSLSLASDIVGVPHMS